MDILDLYLKDYHVAQNNNNNNNNNSSFLEKEVEYIKLPSLGFFYSGKYKNIKELPVRKLNTLDEFILCQDSLYKNDRLYFELLKRVIEDKEFPIEELVSVDRDTILYWLRIGAYGAKYDITCPCLNTDCTHKNKITWDFSLLQFPYYDPAYINYLENNDCLKLEIDSTEWHLVPPTMGKEYAVNNFIINELNKTSEEMLKTQKFLICVKKIVTKDAIYCTIKEIYEFLNTNSLSLKTSKQIQEEINNITLRITLKQQVTCEKCETSTILHLPAMSKTFFGFDIIKHKEYLDEVINYLCFWGRLDYISALHLPSYKRKKWCERTNENLALLYKTK